MMMREIKSVLDFFFLVSHSLGCFQQCFWGGGNCVSQSSRKDLLCLLLGTCQVGRDWPKRRLLLLVA